MLVVKRPLGSVLGFRLEEGILSGWSRAAWRFRLRPC